MKFFVDTADTKDIAELAATGLLDGVTTNPSLIHKSGRDFMEVTKEICGLVDGPVSARSLMSAISAVSAKNFTGSAPGITSQPPL